MKKAIIFIAVFILSLTVVSAAYNCSTIVENAGSVKLINYTFPNVEIEVTVNEYIGSSFLGFFHPMKLQTKNLAEITWKTNETIVNPRNPDDVKVVEMTHHVNSLQLILDNFYNYGRYPRTERYAFRISAAEYKINIFLRAKTFWNVFGADCVQANLGIIEIDETPEGYIPNEKGDPILTRDESIAKKQKALEEKYNQIIETTDNTDNVPVTVVIE